ncbi:MAG TPA: response regulator [Labilithrix sp.]|nr:response regulator [Labilithrix sp.]
MGAGRAPEDPLWRREALAPLLVLVALIGIELTTRFVVRIPNPPALIVILVVFAGFHGGLRSSLASAVVGWAYLTWSFSRAGSPFHYAHDDQIRLVVWGVAIPALAVMVGTLRSRALAAEKAARDEASARFTKSFHASPMGIILSRLSDGQILDANDAALEVLGHSRETLVGQTALDLGLWMNPAQRSATIERLRAEGPLRNIDIQVRTAKGEPADLLCSFETVKGKGETQLLTFLVDITERRRAEEALRRKEEQLHATQKLEAVGRLAGGIAHDFNNLLAVIGGNAELIALEVKDPEALECVAEIVEATGRAAALTRQLLAFSRQEPLRPTLLDVNTTIATLVPFFTRTIGESIALTTDLTPEAVTILADRGQIDQVLTNLVVNARDAMPGGGKLTIQSTTLELDDAAAGRLGPRARGGRFVVLGVADTGAGMEASTLPHIFEPFFTTKGSLHGTGLGLASVHGIVTSSGGFIAVESQPGNGTVFRLYFPASGDAAESTEAPAPRPPSRGGEHVLLVEDDDAVRKLTERLLRELGYSVQVAASPGAAIEIAEKSTVPIDLLLTDVVMPEMNGRELAERVATLLPSAKILFFSGYAQDSVLIENIRERSVAFLAKPFTRDALAAAVRSVLDSEAERKTR